MNVTKLANELEYVVTSGYRDLYLKVDTTLLQAATMLRQQQERIAELEYLNNEHRGVIAILMDEREALNGEIEIVSKLLIGEPISDDDIEKYWNPLHSTLVGRLK